MAEILTAFVEGNIPKIKFACDISVCKGACCTLAGGEGAPLLDDECKLIDRFFPMIQPYLPQEHLETISKYGLYEGTAGSRTTMCYNNRACVFVQYSHGIARCSFEKAFHDEKIGWRKPLSCHLFPIRIDRSSSQRLRYEHISECDSAVLNGEQKGIYLSDFLKEPLIRAFGSSWYEDLQIRCNEERNDKKMQDSFIRNS